MWDKTSIKNRNSVEFRKLPGWWTHYHHKGDIFCLHGGRSFCAGDPSSLRRYTSSDGCSFESRFPSSYSCMLSHFSRVRLSATPWTIARQAALSKGSSRQEDWSGLPFPFPGDLPDPGIGPASLYWQAGSLPPLRCNWPKALCKFKAHSLMIWPICIMKW